MHDRCKSQHRREQVRNDAQRAADRSQKGSAAALHQPGGNGEDDAGSGNEHDDERGDQEFRGRHDKATPLQGW